VCQTRLKLSCKVNDCKPLVVGDCCGGIGGACRPFSTSASNNNRGGSGGGDDEETMSDAEFRDEARRLLAAADDSGDDGDGGGGGGGCGCGRDGCDRCGGGGGARFEEIRVLGIPFKIQPEHAKYLSKFHIPLW